MEKEILYEVYDKYTKEIKGCSYDKFMIQWLWFWKQVNKNKNLKIRVQYEKNTT